MIEMFSRVSRPIAGAAILIAVLAGAAWAQNTLSVSPTSLVFAAQQGSSTVQSQNVQVFSSGVSMVWYAQLPSGSPAWLSFTTPNGYTGTNNLTVTANPAGLAAGSYSGTVQVWSPNSSNASNSSNPLSISVGLTVGATGTIALSATTKTLTATVGGSNPSDTVQVSTASATSIIATATATSTPAGWLSVTPSSATLASGSPATFTIAASISGLAVNTYSGTVTFASGSSTQTLNVTLNLNAGSTISANPNPVYITAQSGTSAVSQSVTVTNTTGSQVTVTPSISSGAGWLSTSGAVTIAASSTGSITFQANPTGLSLGTQTGSVTLTPTGGGTAIQVPVYFTVSATPSITLNKSTLSFNTTTAQLTDSFSLTNSSASAITYTIGVSYTNGSNWLSVNPLGGGTLNASTQQTVNVSAITTGLATGNYYATITVTPTSPSGAAQTVSVTLSVGGAVAVSASPTSLTINAPSTGQSGQATVQISSTNSSVTVAPESSYLYCGGNYCAMVSP
ncbi:MAG: hypothetical protein HY822_13845, partial [Acidobacteria bacterium]|nr:hypothetical protein [Acidobacteriota bacterium]